MAKLTTAEISRSRFADRISSHVEYSHWVLYKLYQSQTSNERRAGTAILLNGVGFTAPDAPRLTKLAEKLVNGKPLSLEDESQLIKLVPKYWKQFTNPLVDDGRPQDTSETPRNPMATERGEMADSRSKEIA